MLPQNLNIVNDKISFLLVRWRLAIFKDKFGYLNFWFWAVVVAKLVKLSFSAPEFGSLSPVIGKFYWQKTKISKKRWEWSSFLNDGFCTLT